MKRSLVICALAVSTLTSLGYGQNQSVSTPRLHVRDGAPVKPPDEQLLPVNSVAPVEPYDRRAYPQKYSSVYMPVSLAVGRVRTSEFTVAKRSEWYDIMLQFEKPLPLPKMQCMTGATSGPLETQRCEKSDPVLGADWTVWLDGHIVQWGSNPTDNCGCIFAAKEFFKLIGSFPLEKGKTYVVQVHFTKDGSSLNVANPHLIVIPHQDMW
jgi:hypothetical protein